MKIIMGDRRTGKTTELIKMSAETGAVIVTPTSQNKKYIFELAKERGLEIPPPITHYQFLERRGNCDKQLYLIDEAQCMIQNLMGGVVAMSLDTTAADVIDLNEDSPTMASPVTSEMIDKLLKPLFAIHHHESNPTGIKFRFVDNQNKEETPPPPAAEPVNLCSSKVSLTPVENTDGQLFVLYVTVERMGGKAEACRFVHFSEGEISGLMIDRLNKQVDEVASGLIHFIDNGGIL